MEIGDGYRAKSNEFVTQGGLPFVRAGNVQTRVETVGLDELPIDLRDRYEPKVSKPGDCLITMKGTVGRVAQVGANTQPFVYSPQVSYWRIKGNCDLVPEFLRYWLQGPEFERQAFAAKSATDMADYINLRDQRRMQMSLPTRRDQLRIAAVLSGLDDLIEISQRRIEVLEDIAHSLYREWFVLRRSSRHRSGASGSQSDRLPQGWTMCRLGDVAKLHYGKSLPKKRRLPGAVSVVSSAGIIDTHNQALVEGPGIVIGRKGNVGSVWWVDGPFFPIDTTYYIESDIPLGYLYWALRELDFVDSHAAVPGLNREQALGVSIPLPPAKLVEEFAGVHDTSFQAVAVARRAIVQLAAIRDLLLPRLVMGDLDISDVDLGVLAPVGAE